MINVLSQALLKNGWLVSLRQIIADFNATYPSNQIAPLSNGVLNGGPVHSTYITIGAMNTVLIDDGKPPITPFTNWQLNYGYFTYLPTLVENINTSLLPVIET